MPLAVDIELSEPATLATPVIVSHIAGRCVVLDMCWGSEQAQRRDTRLGAAFSLDPAPRHLARTSTPALAKVGGINS